MQRALDDRFKATGHQNAYFPLLIPKSFLSREAQHIDGFAKECAVVTHHRLRATADGQGVEVDPEAKLEEELIIRPTSETIIWSTYKNWIQSYRDLPLKLNQWANVYRWEMRTRLFLRTAEFLWQEGHTAHATEAEAVEETQLMLDVYAQFAEDWMAMPVIKGVKTESERFAGAVDTYCIEALMQDGKALQAGTSHFLGQNFAKAFEVTFLTAENKQEFVWASSWGVSTRLMGALVMTHSDDKGLVLPPALAPIQVVIVPIAKQDEELQAVRAYVAPVLSALQEAGVSVKFDDDEKRRPGWKFAEYELQGVPIRLVAGPKDVEKGVFEALRRDIGEKQAVRQDEVVPWTLDQLGAMQKQLFDTAKRRLVEHTYSVDDWEAFKQQVDAGGFVYAHWDGTPETEAKIKEETQATIRCIPLSGQLAASGPGTCVYSGQPSERRVLFAKAY